MLKHDVMLLPNPPPHEIKLHLPALPDQPPHCLNLKNFVVEVFNFQSGRSHLDKLLDKSAGNRPAVLPFKFYKVEPLEREIPSDLVERPIFELRSKFLANLLFKCHLEL